jgi:hypothetical protein
MMYFALIQFGNLVLFINCYYFKDTYFTLLFIVKDMSPDGSGSRFFIGSNVQQEYGWRIKPERFAPKKKDKLVKVYPYVYELKVILFCTISYWLFRRSSWSFRNSFCHCSSVCFLSFTTTTAFCFFLFFFSTIV